MGYAEDRDKRIVQDRIATRMNPNAPTSTIEGKIGAPKKNTTSKTTSAPPILNISQPNPPPISNISFPNYSSPRETLSSGHIAPIRQKKPWFPSIDNAFERISPKWYLFFLLIGAFCGLAYAGATSASGSATVDFIVMGALAGGVLIPAIKFSTKLVLVVLIVGGVIGILYVFSNALSTGH